MSPLGVSAEAYRLSDARQERMQYVTTISVDGLMLYFVLEIALDLARTWCVYRCRT